MSSNCSALVSSTKPSNGPPAESSGHGRGDGKGRSTLLAGSSFSGTRKGLGAMLIHVKLGNCVTWEPTVNTCPVRPVEGPPAAPSALGRFE